MDEFRARRVVDALRDRGIARQRATAPPAAPPLAREGGVFRRFLDGFRYR